jgi:hypothetical protein
MSRPSIETGPVSSTWRTPEGDKLNLSNIQLEMALGLWL